MAEKKPRTAKQLANDQRLRDRKKNTVVPPLDSEKAKAPQVAPPEAKKTVTVDADLLEQLMAKVNQLENNQTVKPNADQQLETAAKMQGYNVNVNANGVQGRVFKYPIEKSFYPDPTERLYDEPKLKRFNLRDNFYFDWDVEGVEYEKYGVTYAEPRFTVRLFRRIFDEDGVTPNGQLALVNRAIQHEDEIIARRAADKLGMADQFESFQDMMNEMRYYRFRQWLLDLFTPIKIEHHARQATQMVIDGKVVEVFDTEAIIDGETGKEKAASIETQVRI